MAFEIHLYTSFLAMGLGAIILLCPKGTLPHRVMGGTWVVAMVLSAVSSFWLGGGVLPVVGHLGPIHLLSLWMLIALAMAVAAISRGQARAHRGWMVGAYLGLMGAFAGTLAPGRWVANQIGLW